MTKKGKRSPSRKIAGPKQGEVGKSRRKILGTAILGLLVLMSLGVWIVRPSLFIGLWGHGLGELPQGVRPSDLNLVLITLDTTRADRIHAYGFPAVETPNLDRIAAEGVLFEQAVSAAPLTLPAHATIWTGRFPPTHGVRDNGGFFLDESEETLAERLKQNGFRTGGFIGAYVLDSEWGIAQGFDTYFDDFDLSNQDVISQRSIDRPGNEVADRALAWLDTVASSRFFAWVHFHDPHAPYRPPEPFATRYADRPYVGEIAFTDSQVGRILDWLDRNKLTEKTIIVVIGDHGESLGEHGETRHGVFLYDAVMRVPFLVRAPFDRMRKRRIDDVVRSADVLPTILELLGLPSPSGVEGESLAPLMTGDADHLDLSAYSESLYPRLHFGWSDLRSVRCGNVKYIDAPRPELYDVAADPNEAHNLYAERPGVAKDLKSRLVELESRFHIAAPASRRTTGIDPDTRDRLAALGYLGAFLSGPSSEEDRSSLADPKHTIEIVNLMLVAREKPHSDEAVKALEAVIARDPQVIDAWLMLGNEYSRRREFEDAIEKYARALELKPDCDLPVIYMANAYRPLRRDEMAMAVYRRFMDLNPGNPRVRYEIAQILVDNGKFDEAHAQLQRALELEPHMAAARNALGVVLIGQGDLEGAESQIREALEQNPRVRYANHNLALIAEERKDFRSAIASYEKEIELYPRSHKSIYNLGKLQGYLGNGRAQRECYRRAIEVNPDFAEGHLALAKLYLDTEQNLDEAMELAQKGLALSPESAYAPMGHYILADIYTRQGQSRLAAQELAKAKALEARLRER